MHASAGLVDPKAELTIGADVTLIESMPTYPTRDHIRAVRLSHCRQQDIMRFWYFNSYPGVLAAAAAAALKVSPLLPLLTMAPNHALAPAPSVNLGGE
ncbi:hypothetical protein GW17_00032870 [Ensete ventricosum]|nr:hypothetical protein GW17_00032870 [Ensete ventricosum]